MGVSAWGTLLVGPPLVGALLVWLGALLAEAMGTCGLRDL